MAQVALGGALGRRWSPLTPQHFVRRQHLSSFVGLRFAWQACYRLHLVARLVAVGRRWSPVTPRHFEWQAWHLATSIFVSCGRRVTWRHPPAFHVAGVPLGDIYLRFVWQAWYRLHLVAVGRRWSPVTPRHFAWQAWHLATSIFVHVVGVALGDIHLRFTWQAWHLATSTFVLCGRRATGCTWSPLVAGDAAALCVAAWHLATSIFVSCGRRATWRHPPAFHVAGVALGDIYLRFVWQAWYRLHLVARLVAVGRW